MIQKTYGADGRACRVTFRFVPEQQVDAVHLVGEFNDWDKEARPLTRRKDGSFSTTVALKPGADYRFRYLIDGEDWVNDPDADGFVDNGVGSLDSIVRV
jgi:1,4-alpha-glucan branching enzyme